MVAVKTPGTVLRRILEDKDITDDEFIERAGFSDDEAEALFDGELEITPGVAKKIEKGTDIKASFFLNLERIYRDR